MKRTLWIPLLAVVFALPTNAARVADQDAQPAAEPQNAAERCDALIEKAEAAQNAWIEEYRAKVKAARETDEDLPAFSWDNSPLKDFLPQFQALAEEFAGTEGAIAPLIWIVSDASWIDTDATKSAIETLFEVHIESEELETLSGSLRQFENILGVERNKQLLSRIEELSPSKKLCGWATYTRVIGDFEDAELDSEAYASLKQTLLAAAEASGDKRLKSSVAKKTRVREHFALGMTAPDITGVDLDGVAFNLSDYTGKVLFVDFWGDW
jgi:DNA-binding ferritin-like protein (Dps family)